MTVGKVTALVRAMQVRSYQVVDLLLDNDADINMQVEGIRNKTPLMIAVQLVCLSFV